MGLIFENGYEAGAKAVNSVLSDFVNHLEDSLQETEDMMQREKSEMLLDKTYDEGRQEVIDLVRSIMRVHKV